MPKLLSVALLTAALAVGCKEKDKPADVPKPSAPAPDPSPAARNAEAPKPATPPAPTEGSGSGSGSAAGSAAASSTETPPDRRKGDVQPGKFPTKAVAEKLKAMKAKQEAADAKKTPPAP